jgi:LmbE family N-acetylglucosaminyl deacetylase
MTPQDAPSQEWRSDDLPARLLVLAPHPDDEVLGCGRLMRRVAAAGGQVVVAWLTDGGASHGELNAPERRDLAGRRQIEALGGLAELGVTPAATCFMGYPDGALAAVEAKTLASRLQALCDSHRIDTVVVTDDGDGHADHRAAFAIARRLAVGRLFAYPISARYDGEPYAPPQAAFLVSPEAGDDKRVALARHVSQSVAGGARLPLSAATIDRFCAEPEVFMLVERGAY